MSFRAIEQLNSQENSLTLLERQVRKQDGKGRRIIYLHYLSPCIHIIGPERHGTKFVSFSDPINRSFRIICVRLSLHLIFTVHKNV